jgi:cytochrome c
VVRTGLDLFVNPPPDGYAQVVHTMKKHLLLPTLALGGFCSTAAVASDDITALARASGCLSCHAVAEKIVGPAFQSVSAKYAQDKDAVDTLVQSIKNGQRGKWGRIPMPPNPSLSADELKQLATWVMSHKP